MVDVSAKLAARVRLLSTGPGRKTDAADAASVGIAALTATGLHTVAVNETDIALRALADAPWAKPNKPRSVLTRIETTTSCVSG